MFHAGIEPARADRLIERIVAYCPEALAITSSEAGDRRGIEPHLADRPDDEPLAAARAALGERVEIAYGLDLVAEEIDSQRLGGSRREEIHDAASDRVFPRLGHGAVAQVAVGREERHHARGRQLGTLLHGKPCLEEAVTQRHALEEGGNRGDHEPGTRALVGEPPKSVDAPRDDVPMGRNAVIGQAVPGGNAHHRAIRGEEGQSLLETGHPGVVDAHMQEVAALRQRAQQKPVEALGCSGQEPATWAAEIECRYRARVQPRPVPDAFGSGHGLPSLAKLAVIRRRRSSPIPVGHGARPVSQS